MRVEYVNIYIRTETGECMCNIKEESMCMCVRVCVLAVTTISIK